MCLISEVLGWNCVKSKSTKILRLCQVFHVWPLEIAPVVQYFVQGVAQVYPQVQHRRRAVAADVYVYRSYWQ